MKNMTTPSTTKFESCAAGYEPTPPITEDLYKVTGVSILMGRNKEGFVPFLTGFNGSRFRVTLGS